MNKLSLYNTKKRQKEIFEPIDSQRVTMYVCGPTVYNRVHIGNARPAVVFDVLYRLLSLLYPDVVYARNITDIDDKIMKAADELNESITQISERFAAAYFEDMAAIHNLDPTIQPYATDHLPQMISLIERLLEKNHAYVEQGHVLFDVLSMENYGELSNRNLEDMLAGARVEVAPYKKYAGDFVLWKPSSDEEPGWESPWGRGRPGWHIECSAMVETHLGESIDIHGGGRDLIFPHHENEIAQSECAHDGKVYVRYWMHNGYINIDGEKMSKSLGNFRLVNDLLKQYSGETIRFALLTASYRSELNFSSELLEQAKATLDTLYGALQMVETIEAETPESIMDEPFFAALLDDLNTPKAISELHQLARLLRNAEAADAPKIKGRMLACANLLGLLQQNPTQWFQAVIGEATITDEEVEGLIAERNQAKLDKNYQRADEIRNELEEKSIILEDSREGTQWRRS